MRKNISESRLKKIKKVVDGRQSGLTVVFEDMHDPHNVAAIIRTCDGFGIQKVHLIFEKERPYKPHKVGKSSSSTANKWLDYEIHSSTEACIKLLKQDGFIVIATTLSSDVQSVYATAFSQPKIAILVGNEFAGLSEKAISLSDLRVCIPMRGMVQSLNVSVATAIFLYEVTRQRIEMDMDVELTNEDHKELLDSLSKR